MPQRFNITLGATTTAGGVVKTASSFASTNGAILALEGDIISCAACYRDGRIKCDGHRLDATFNGRNYALSDDLCICNCDPPPRLVANQSSMFQIVDGSGSAASTATSSIDGPDALADSLGSHDLALR